MRLAQHGRVEAYEILHERIAAATLDLCLRVTRDVTLAEEVAQETFVAIWRSCGHYDPDRGSPRAWMLRIAHNHAIDGLRSSLRHDRRRAWIDDSHFREASTDCVEDQVGLRERTRELHRMLAHLPAEQRQILALAFFGDLSHSEIARALGLPIGTVKGRARLGLGHLRKLLDDDVVAQLVA